jgi:hypothetical protein
MKATCRSPPQQLEIRRLNLREAPKAVFDFDEQTNIRPADGEQKRG